MTPELSISRDPVSYHYILHLTDIDSGVVVEQVIPDDTIHNLAHSGKSLTDAIEQHVVPGMKKMLDVAVTKHLLGVKKAFGDYPLSRCEFCLAFTNRTLEGVVVCPVCMETLTK